MPMPRLFLVVIPLLPLLRRRTQIEARANDPEKEENSEDGTNDDTRDCSAAQGLAIVTIPRYSDSDGLDSLAGDEGWWL
jgi:hypothetical protein